MKKLSPLIIVLIFLGVNAAAGSVNQWVSWERVWADEYDDLVKEKQEKLAERGETEREKKESEVKKQSLAEQVAYYRAEFARTQGDLEAKKRLIAEIEENKAEKEAEQAVKIQQKNMLVRNLYKQSELTPLELFLGVDGFSSLAKVWHYYQRVISEGRRQIAELNFLIDSLESLLDEETKKKAELEDQVKTLSAQTVHYKAQVTQTEKYIEELTDQIAALETEIQNITERQEELIREKLAATAVFTSVGETEQAKQVLPDPGFSPAYAVFSYGYPHRVGMNQYGAYGRAKAGQSAEEILKAYYQNIKIVEYDVPEEITIKTADGTETINFEENYLRGIAEMPTAWGDSGGFEALKAQAIAARTYALAVTNNGQGAICITQSCQVYRASKVDSDAAARWHEAVEETRGLVIVYDGSPIKAWYSSTAGGYTRLPTDFDVRWNSSPAYIKRIVDLDDEGHPYDGPGRGDSPWFHKAWYASSDGHPWLTQEEILDLLNAARLPESYNEHLSQEEAGGWSKEEVEEALEAEGLTPLKEITDIKSIFSEEGYTKFLRIDTTDGHVDIDGKRFRQIFILRSRGKLALWSSLYDVVRR